MELLSESNAMFSSIFQQWQLLKLLETLILNDCKVLFTSDEKNIVTFLTNEVII